jgi:cbb3-type cytochrome oxidase subunit 1
MEKYPKLFIKASVFYLVLGTLMGVLMGTQLITSAGFRFVHIHVNLIGFMAMFIFGVAYHILPRFNGRPVRYPDWIPVQYYLMNIGLVGLLTFYMLGGLWEAGMKSILLGFFFGCDRYICYHVRNKYCICADRAKTGNDFYSCPVTSRQ